MLTLTPNSNRAQLSSYQKRCPQCHLVQHIEVAKCLQCGHTLWRWKSHLRLLLLLVFLTIPILLVVRSLTTQEEVYRMPMMAPSPEKYG